MSRRDLGVQLQGVRANSQISTPCYTAKEDWNIPKVATSQFYKSSSWSPFTAFKTDYHNQPTSILEIPADVGAINSETYELSDLDL